jgi:hypothetical protein
LAKETGRGAPSYVEYAVQDASPAVVRELRQRLMGCHWEYQGQMLEILEWVCGTDRQFERARKRALDLINGEERALLAIVMRSLAKENGDAAQAR